MVRQARAFLEMIKFEHTVFALPFAYLGMVMAAGGWPSGKQFLLVTVAMAAARTFGMGANRVIDREIDRRNPRTSGRALVTGTLRSSVAWAAMLVSAGVLGVSAWALGPLPLLLAPLALAYLVTYSYSKRFTWLSHYALGFADGLAPVGGWVAVRGSLFTTADAPAWMLLLIVTVWMGGVDILYACADVDVDRRDGLHAIPARFGLRRAMQVSALSHVVTVLLLIVLGWSLHLGWIYWLGIAATTVMLVYEHRLVHPQDLTRLDMAFFNVNGYISLTLFAATLGAFLLG